MSPEAKAPETSDPARAPIVRRVGLLVGPPLLFLLVLTARYALASFACGSDAARVALEIVAAMAVLAAGAGALAAWRTARHDVDRVPAAHPADDSERSSRFLGRLALASALLFTLVLVAMWLPSWLLRTCPYAS